MHPETRVFVLCAFFKSCVVSKFNTNSSLKEEESNQLKKKIPQRTVEHSFSVRGNSKLDCVSTLAKTSKNISSKLEFMVTCNPLCHICLAQGQ